jgi:predicted DCC family thiol-disulfide oxidoreductase YuxK
VGVETSGAVARSGPLARPVVLYQDRCRFCRAAARLVARLDKRQRLALLPYDDPDAAQFVVFLERGRIEESWQLIEPDGRRLTHGDALVRLLQVLLPTRRLGRVLHAPWLVRLATIVDRLISKARPFLSRFVPDRPGPRRWP